MAKGISVSVASDTREFAAGVKKGMVDPLVSAEDTLGKLAAAGDAAGGKLETSFKAQQTATERLKGDIDQLNVRIREGAQQSGRAMETSYDEAVKRTEEGLAEAKNAATQNAVSTAASFDGSFNSIAGGVQGLVSEFAVGFGPAGVVAGTVAAAGIGLVSTAIDNATQATEVDKQAVADLANQYIAAGTVGKRSFDDVKQSITDMAADTPGGSAVISLTRAWYDAKLAGTDYEDAVQAIAEADPQHIARAMHAVDGLKQTWSLTGAATVDVNLKSSTATTRQQAAVTDLSSALHKAHDQAVAAGRAQELAAAAGLSKFQLKADALGQLHDAYASAAGEVARYQDKESGILEVSKYVKAMERKRHELLTYEKTLRESGLSAAAKSYIESLGESDAASYMAGYAKATPKQRAQLDSIWSTAGKTNAQTYGEALGQRIQDIKAPAPRIPPPVVPAPDTSKLDAFLRTPRVARVIVEAYTRTGQRVL